MEGGLSKRGGIGKKKSGDLNSGQSTYIWYDEVLCEENSMYLKMGLVQMARCIGRQTNRADSNVCWDHYILQTIWWCLRWKKWQPVETQTRAWCMQGEMPAGSTRRTQLCGWNYDSFQAEIQQHQTIHVWQATPMGVQCREETIHS